MIKTNHRTIYPNLLKRMRNYLSKLFKIFVQNGRTNTDLSNYDTALSRCGAARHCFVFNRESKLLLSRNKKMVWNFCRSRSSKSSTSIPPLMTGGDVVENNLGKDRKFNDFFSSVFFRDNEQFLKSTASVSQNTDRKSTRLNSSHRSSPRMPSSA